MIIYFYKSNPATTKRPQLNSWLLWVWALQLYTHPLRETVSLDANTWRHRWTGNQPWSVRLLALWAACAVASTVHSTSTVHPTDYSSFWERRGRQGLCFTTNWLQWHWSTEEWSGCISPPLTKTNWELRNTLTCVFRACMSLTSNKHCLSKKTLNHSKLCYIRQSSLVD